MNSIGASGQRNVDTGIDQQARRWRILTHNPNHFPRQHFQFPPTQIFLAELYVIDAIAGTFSDLVEQSSATILFTAAKLAAVGNVIEQTAIRHVVWRGHSCPRKVYGDPNASERTTPSDPAHCAANNFKFSAFHRIAA